MKKITILFLAFLALNSNAQKDEYNEESIRQVLDKFIENPKLYFDKIKNLNEKVSQANQNTMKVSEEYLNLIDKKDSVIKLYKVQVDRLKTGALAAQSPASNQSKIAAVPVQPTKPAQVATTKSPYRVQLAAFNREEFKQFFSNFSKTISVETLPDRNVIEVQGFFDADEAYAFAQRFRQLGFDGAFVSKYNGSERIEGYSSNSLATNSPSPSKSSAPVPAFKTTLKNPTKSLDYPSWKPLGYQEIKEGAVAPKLAASTPSTPPPSAPAIKMPPTRPLATNTPAPTPPPVAKPLATKIADPAPTAPTRIVKAETPPAPSNPPAAKVNRDQLDAAFDQLFKK